MVEDIAHLYNAYLVRAGFEFGYQTYNSLKKTVENINRVNVYIVRKNFKYEWFYVLKTKLPTKNVNIFYRSNYLKFVMKRSTTSTITYCMCKVPSSHKVWHEKSGRNIRGQN